jgi:hypothetical protein
MGSQRKHNKGMESAQHGSAECELCWHGQCVCSPQALVLAKYLTSNVPHDLYNGDACCTGCTKACYPGTALLRLQGCEVRCSGVCECWLVVLLLPHPASVEVEWLSPLVAVQDLLQVAVSKDDAALEEGVRGAPRKLLNAAATKQGAAGST